MLELDHARDGNVEEVASARRATPLVTAAEISTEPRTLKVLVVEDDPADFAVIERCLSHMTQFEARITLAAHTRGAAFALTADDFDLLIVDHSLGHARVFNLLAGAQRTMRCPSLLVANQVTSELETEAHAAGVALCVAKDELTSKMFDTILKQFMRGGDTETVPQPPSITRKPRRNRIAQRITARDQTAAGETIDAQSLLVELAHRHRSTGAVARGQISLRLQDKPLYIDAGFAALAVPLADALKALNFVSAVVGCEAAKGYARISISAVHGNRSRPVGVDPIADLEHQFAGIIVEALRLDGATAWSLLLPLAETA